MALRSDIEQTPETQEPALSPQRAKREGVVQTTLPATPPCPPGYRHLNAYRLTQSDQRQEVLKILFSKVHPVHFGYLRRSGTIEPIRRLKHPVNSVLAVGKGLVIAVLLRPYYIKIRGGVLVTHLSAAKNACYCRTVSPARSACGWGI